MAIELAAIPVLQEDPLDYDETLMEERLTASEVKSMSFYKKGPVAGKLGAVILRMIMSKSMHSIIRNAYLMEVSNE